MGYTEEMGKRWLRTHTTLDRASADRTFVGHGADTDIVVASAKALMNALNRALAHLPRQEQVWANP